MQNVCKINLSLSDQPLYVSITDDKMSVDAIITEAVKQMRDSGKSHEATQLEQLYKDHEIHCRGKQFTKGTLFSELSPEKRTVGVEIVQFAEIELIKQHVGGIDFFMQLEREKLLKENFRLKFEKFILTLQKEFANTEAIDGDYFFEFLNGLIPSMELQPTEQEQFGLLCIRAKCIHQIVIDYTDKEKTSYRCNKCGQTWDQAEYERLTK